MKRHLQCAEQQAASVTLQLHQILRLARKMILMIDPDHISMKHNLQCAEQQHSPSNVTKYCACHAKFSFALQPIQLVALSVRRSLSCRKEMQ